MNFKPDEAKNLMQELITSHEWACLSERLSLRHQSAMNELKSVRDVDQMIRNQEHVKAIEYILNLPKQIIEEHKNGK